jgi:hypothetical protein
MYSGRAPSGQALRSKSSPLRARWLAGFPLQSLTHFPSHLSTHTILQMTVLHSSETLQVLRSARADLALAGL